LLKLGRRVASVLLWFLRWVVPIVIGLAPLWMIGGNLLANQQEKQVDQALKQFVQQIPSREANNSALKLEQLSANLGLGRLLGTKTTPTRYLHLPVPQTSKTSFQTIRDSLNQYLDSQLDKPNDDIDAPPEDVRQYLADHALELEAIYTHVLSSELPRWELGYDISTFGDVAVALPSFLNTANFQKILAVDILDKTRQGQTQVALKILEVSWKLNQVLLERSELIAQLVVIINSSPQAGVMRKMQGLPAEWQERLDRFNQHDLPQGFLKGLYSEAFFGFVSGRKYAPSTVFESYKIWDFPLPKWLNSVIDPLAQPYVRLAGVEHSERMRQMTLKLPEQDFCTFDSKEFYQQTKTTPAWWSLFSAGDFAGQWHKVGKAVLRFEFTQKVLQVKEIAQRQGSLPKQIPKIESSVCRDARWIYQLSPKGDASISYSQELDWMKREGKYEPGDRLQYSFQVKQKKPNFDNP
jgi:hypothetical protein